MGDSVSLPTSIAQVDTVARTQQGQQTNQQAEEKFAKALREQADEESALLKNVAESERTRLEREREERRRRRRRERAVQAKGEDPDAPGQRVDVKA